jgi:hypothetical protein
MFTAVAGLSKSDTSQSIVGALVICPRFCIFSFATLIVAYLHSLYRNNSYLPTRCQDDLVKK